MPGRQAFREYSDGDYVRGATRAVEFGASFLSDGLGKAASMGAGACGSYLDLDRGIITEAEHREQLMMIGASGAAALPRGPKAFKSATTRPSRTADRIGHAAYDFMQRAAALNRPQRVLVYVNSGPPRAFMVGYQPIPKLIPTQSSMKAHGRGATVGRGQAPIATASTNPAARPTVRPQAAGHADPAGARPHNEWKIESYDKVVEHSKFGKLYRDPKTNLWWSKDTAGHGGSQWKVFEEKGKGLQWFKDADQYGTYLTGKHKGPIGTFIPWKNLGGKK